MGLDREAAENGRARVSFPSSLSRCFTYWNRFLRSKGILPEQSIVTSGHGKVSVVKQDKTNILLLCESRKA